MIQRNVWWIERDASKLDIRQSRGSAWSIALVAGLFALGCSGGDGTGAEGEAADVTAPGAAEQGGIVFPPTCTPPKFLVCPPSGAPCYCSNPPSTNLSVNRPSFQSSTVLGGVAARANDGNTNGNWAAGSVNHTDASMGGQWWYVDLGSDKTVTEVRIFNRTDCCSERLSHYNISAWINGSWQVVSNHANDNTAGVSSMSWPVNVKTKFIMIQKTDANWLHLAEVQVMGF